MDHAFVYSEKMGNVEPYNCWDGDILSILDFPMESLEGGDDDDNGFIGDWDYTNYGSIIPSHDTASHVSQPMSLLSHFQAEQKVDLKTQSPVSVIESNGSSFLTGGKIKRARSKRARPSGLSPWILMSPPFAKTCIARKNRESGDILSPPWVAKKSIDMDSVTKRCGHCQVTQTPQWRGGPMGPKTLCNACGVRYRSGRLLPEYRPAASPTFVPSLHSNSHKKVVEMRKGVQKEQVKRNEQPSMSPGDGVCSDE